MSEERDTALASVERARDRASLALRRLEEIAGSPEARRAVADAEQALSALLTDLAVERAA